MGEVKGKDGETDSGVRRGSLCRILCFIRFITLLGETLVSSSLSLRRGDIKGLFLSSMLPLNL